jgi:hypothetical protein
VSDGYIDTNVFLHAAGNDADSKECLHFLERLELGRAHARLEPVAWLVHAPAPAPYRHSERCEESLSECLARCGERCLAVLGMTRGGC